MSMEASRQGWLAMQPYDERYGCDLRDPQSVAGLKQDLLTLQPRLAIVEFPCKWWSNLLNLSYGTTQAKRRIWKKFQEKELPFLELCEEVFDIQSKNGADALAENPQRSQARLQLPMVRLTQRPETTTPLPTCAGITRGT